MRRRLLAFTALLPAAALALAPMAAHADPISAAIASAIMFVPGATIGTALAVSSFIVTTAFTIAASAVINTLFGPKAPNTATADRQASVTQLQIGETPRQAIFGLAATGGSLVDVFSYGGPNGDDWEVRIIALADHLCERLYGYWVADTAYSFAAPGSQPGFAGQLEMYVLTGAPGETWPDFVTANSDWTDADITDGDSVFKVVVQAKADAADAVAPIFGGSFPDLLWLVQGKKCYDRRLDDTAGGSGSQRWTDPSTWTWSENAAVCHENWQRGVYALDQVDQPDQLLVGRGMSAFELIDDATFAADANLCDELIDLGGGMSEHRYRVGCSIGTDEAFLDVEQMFADAMSGMVLQPYGAVHVEPGQGKDPVAFFTDDDLDDAFPEQYSSFKSVVDRVNTVVPKYIEPAQRWTSISGPVQRVDTDTLIADGGPLEKDCPQDFVSWPSQAARAANILLQTSRLEATATCTLKPLDNFPAIEDGDWVVWTSARHTGGEPMSFLVLTSSLDQGWRNSLTLQQVDFAAYGFGGSGIEIPIPPSPVPPDALTLAGVTAEHIDIEGDDGSIVPAVRFHWTVPVAAAVTQIRAEIRPVADLSKVSSDQKSAVNDGQLVTTNGVGANMALQGRLIPLGPAGLPIVPSDWIDIGTGDFVSSNSAKFGDYTPASLAAAFAAIDPGSDTTVPDTLAAPTVSFTVVSDGTGGVTTTLKATTAASVDDNIAGYEFQIQLGTSPALIASTTALSYDMQVPAGTAYSVEVRAVKLSGTRGVLSAAATGTTAKDAIPPGAPSALTATGSIGSNFLKWTNPADSDLAQVEVWASTTDVQPVPATDGALRIGSVNSAPNLTGSYTHASLATGVTWYYWVRAVDTSGNAGPFNAADGAAATPVGVGTGDLQLLAVTSGALAAGAVSPSKLAIISDNLFRDPNFQDPAGCWEGNYVQDMTTATVIRAPGGPAFTDGWELDPAVAAGLGAAGAIALADGFPASLGYDHKRYGQYINLSSAPSQYSTVVAGQAYELSALFWNACNQDCYLSLEYVDASGAVLGSSSLVCPGGAGIVALAIQVVPPAGSISARPLILNFGDSVLSGFMGIGSISLRKAGGGTLIVDGSITGDKVAANTIAGTNILAGTLTATNIQVASLTGNLLAANTITGDLIAAATITGTNILAGSLTATQIAVGSITADRMDIATLDALSANLGVVNTGLLQSTSTNCFFDLTNEMLVFKAGGYMRVSGAGFGTTGQFLEWYGPIMAISSCNETSALYYLRNDGAAYFHGAIAAGTLSNSTSGSDLSSTATTTLGPFGTEGGAITVVWSYSYNHVARRDAGTTGVTGSLAATLSLYRTIAGSAEVLVDSHTIGGSVVTDPGDPGESPDVTTGTMSGSWTFTDTTGGVLDKSFRIAVSSRSDIVVTGSGGIADVISQRESIISSEG